MDLETGAIVAVTLQEAVAAVTDDKVKTGEELVDDKGYHSKQTLLDYSPWDYAPTSVNRIALGSTGSISTLSATRCMLIGGAFGASAGSS